MISLSKDLFSEDLWSVLYCLRQHYQWEDKYIQYLCKIYLWLFSREGKSYMRTLFTYLENCKNRSGKFVGHSFLHFYKSICTLNQTWHLIFCNPGLPCKWSKKVFADEIFVLFHQNHHRGKLKSGPLSINGKDKKTSMSWRLCRSIYYIHIHTCKACSVPSYELVKIE